MRSTLWCKNSRKGHEKGHTEEVRAFEKMSTSNSDQESFKTGFSEKGEG